MERVSEYLETSKVRFDRPEVPSNGNGKHRQSKLF
jgi:hypothetical protein